MKLPSLFKMCSLSAILMLPVATGAQTAPADAAPPAAVATLDVCHDEVSGRWRYSGVLALAGRALDGKVIGID